MNSKERFRALLSGEIPDHIGRADAPWPETRKRWQEEGLPAGTHANDHFSMDIRRQFRTDGSFFLPESVQEETDEYRIIRTADGNLEKYWKTTGVPQQLEYGLRTAEDWYRLKERLVPSPERLAFGYYGDYGYEYTSGPFDEVRAAWEACTDKETTVVPISVAEPYEAFMAKLGDEHILMKLILEPELIADMFDAQVRFTCGMVDLACDLGLNPDCVFVGGDIAYKNGLMFGPQLYRELLMPRHAAMFRHFHERGLKIIYHTDGNCTEALPMLIEAGIDCIQPLEVVAGMDIRKLADAFGSKVAFMGNVSVKALAGDPHALEEEVRSKVKFAAENRVRYIFHSDHSVPPEVSFANYSRAIGIVEEEGTYA